MEEAFVRVVLRSSDLRFLRDIHVVRFLVIEETGEMEEELDRRLGWCRVVDDADQEDIAVWES